jgi:autotransporter translocation and assembly factor TamB
LLSITFKNDSVQYKTNLTDKTPALSKHLLQKIQYEDKRLNLIETSSLRVTSNGRFTGGALSANFTIKTNTNVFTSSGFNHENPPKELVFLYNFLKTAKKVEK